MNSELADTKDSLKLDTSTKAIIVSVVLFVIAVISFLYVNISKANNKEIFLQPQIALLKPFMEEIEKSSKEGKAINDLTQKQLFFENNKGEIVASGYKNGVLYLNTMKERKNYHVDDALLVMKPIVKNNNVTWNCYYAQGGKVVDGNEYNCVKTSTTMQRQKRKNAEDLKIDLAYDLFDDRDVLKKAYLIKGLSVPQELLEAERIDKQLLAKIEKNKKKKEDSV